MRSRALARVHRAPPTAALRSPSPAALVFLNGHAADARLRELAAARASARPVLGALAAVFCAGRAHERLGRRSLGDYAREQLGVGARVVREWARVWRALQELPGLRGAVLAGEVGWSVARLVVGSVTPETDRACVETVRGRTVRAVKVLLQASREAEPHLSGGTEEALQEREDDDAGVVVRIPCDPRCAVLWTAAVELARRVAGDPLPIWQCAERMAAEAASALGAPDVGGDVASPVRGPARRAAPGADESGLRVEAFPWVSWKPRAAAVPPELATLVEGIEGCDAHELGRRLRAAVVFLQRVDFEMGRILRQVQQRRLFTELGFDDFGRYGLERLDLAPRTARRLVALARAEHRAPALATAFRRGEIHAGQAQTLLRVADLASARRWLAHSRQVSLRRLEDDVDAAAPAPRAIVFRAPRAVAALFLAMVARAGSLERLLAHAVATWIQQGEQFRDYADFARDGFRCTAPGCTARRNLQSHHIRFRSAGGPDAVWNRTTLCAFHHERGVHRERTLSICGHAPGGLVFALGPEPGAERYRTGDVRLPPARTGAPHQPG